MFYDEAKIKIKAGDGGNGLTSFRSEKFLAKGGPDGGDGGHGGSVYFQVNPELGTLQDFNAKKYFEAQNGGNGGRNNRKGADGDDLVMEVPQGTMIYSAQANELLFDMTEEDEKVVITKGGRGGRGNAYFATSTNQAPQLNELGEPGQEIELRLELKLVADVAIVGVPSAGKSTLISVISNAKPKIADYPFTTLVPNLGVVSVDRPAPLKIRRSSKSKAAYKKNERKFLTGYSFVVVDVPGLIKDAYKGKGLGDAFLRHIERSRIIVHLVDTTSSDPAEDYKVIRNELKLYNKELAKKPEIVVLNKIDTIESDKELLDDMVKNLEKASGKKVYPISAVAQKGVKELLYEIKDELKKLPKKKIVKEKIKVFRPQERLMKNYSVKKEGDTFIVSGKRLERFASQTNPDLEQGIVRLLKVIDSAGVIKELTKKGIKDGHLVKIGKRTGRFQNGMIVIIG